MCSFGEWQDMCESLHFVDPTVGFTERDVNLCFLRATRTPDDELHDELHDDLDEQEQGLHGQHEQRGRGRVHSPREPGQGGQGGLCRASHQLRPGSDKSSGGAHRVNSRDLLSTIQHLHRHERPRDHNLLS